MMRRKGFALLSVMTLSATLLAGISPSSTDTVLASSAETATAGCRTDNHGLTLKTTAGTGDAHFQTIQFLSSNIGRAAGNGFMIGTSDGGCNWQAIQSNGQYSFNQIQFLTNSIGYALAQTNSTQPNVLLRTADGGSTFKTIPTGGNVFNRVAFFSQQVGFGFTQAFTFKTTNGGQTWTKIPTPPNTRYANFTTVDNGWIITLQLGVGYQVMQTTNGGQTWTKKLTVPSQTTIGGMIKSTDSTNVWVVLYGDSGMSQTSYSVYHTSNAGVSWKELVSNSTAGGGPAPGPVVQGLKGPAGAPQDIQVIDNKAVYLAASSGAYENVAIGRSLDNGGTWNNLAGVLGYGGRLSFPTTSTGWIATTSSASSGVYVTTNSGVTWSKQFSLPATK